MSKTGGTDFTVVKGYLLLLIASQSQMYKNQLHPPVYPKDQEIQSAHKTLLMEMRNSMMKRKGKETKRKTEERNQKNNANTFFDGLLAEFLENLS